MGSCTLAILSTLALHGSYTPHPPCLPSAPPAPPIGPLLLSALGGSPSVSFAWAGGPLLHQLFHVHPTIVKVFLIFHKGLRVVLLENVTGALKSNRGEIPFFDKLLLALRSAVPFWRWGVDEVNCKDYLSAQNRPRVVLRGTMQGSATE